MIVDYSVFCGDAVGRPGDFSDSDKQFVLNEDFNGWWLWNGWDFYFSLYF